jgi:phospholipid/cholesterol/gamma-HCH transport system substrate-binding protein
MQKKTNELLVGLFIIVAILAFIFLALQVSGLSLVDLRATKNYTVKAEFSDIGSLNKHAAIRIAGVQIGHVSNITLNKNTYKAIVVMSIDSKYSIPNDSSAGIQTMGILGDSFISIQPGYASKNLPLNGVIHTTYPATNLNSLISTFAGQGK